MSDPHLAPKRIQNPAPTLSANERLITQFQGNKATYIREHILLAALGSVIMVSVLMAIGNPHAWTGVVGAVLAIAARGFYVADEQLGFIWYLTDHRLVGPAEREIPVAQIANVRHIFSAVQVITKRGDKYLIKYQADVEGATAAILSAAE